MKRSIVVGLASLLLAAGPAGARLKAGSTQDQPADKLAIRQNRVSDQERGRRSQARFLFRALRTGHQSMTVPPASR